MSNSDLGFFSSLMKAEKETSNRNREAPQRSQSTWNMGYGYSSPQYPHSPSRTKSFLGQTDPQQGPKAQGKDGSSAGPSADRCMRERVDWEKKATELDVLSKRYRKERDDSKKELEHTRTLYKRVEDQLQREKAEAVAAQARNQDEIIKLKGEVEGGASKEEVAGLQSALAESQGRLAEMAEKVRLAIVEIQEQKANCRERDEELLEANGVITRMEFDAREYKIEKEDLEVRLSQSIYECRRLERKLEARDEEGGLD